MSTGKSGDPRAYGAALQGENDTFIVSPPSPLEVQTLPDAELAGPPRPRRPESGPPAIGRGIDSGGRLAPGAAVPVPPTLASGRFALGAELGHGGVAKVVRAYDTHLKVERAIKLIMTEDDGLRSSLRRRLKSEARAMIVARHPHVLPVHEFGEEDGIYYVVTDVAEHGSVMEKMEKTGVIPKVIATRWIIQTLAALTAAHEQGIIHRDVKPHNLMLDKFDRILLGDFGIALLLNDERRTKAGVAMGSFAYMPPEQRVDASSVGPTADIYAAGATLYHMLTGENPVDLFLVDDHSPRWRKLPIELRDIIRRACSSQPAERYQTAERMAFDLMRSLEVDSADTAYAMEKIAPFPPHSFPPSPARTREPPMPPVQMWPYFALGLGSVTLAASIVALLVL